ncbi:DUF2207 domain-containing protein [Lewinella sp. 4G2]|uniref:DUF2207 domain-containing protein n=1 Tax=Lewinella sp. 4G2 TaxID=1803372 RepID=UPI0007B493D3|nr:DUF2207 domain-containing protein [Lewinella sp. 4G2]OAV43352.1 hypothetical protein A3850_002060 [Lewinella sp. 4G2]
MRQLFTFGLLLFTLCLSAQTERVTNWSAVMDVRSDGSIDVEETISVVATGDIIKRGITRAITRKPIGGDHDGNFSYELISATRNGETIEPFEKSSRSLTTFYLGSKEETLPPGEYTYVFNYTSADQIYFMEFIDEIRWHHIDTDGKLPVEKADITVRFTAGTNILGADCYAGREGSNDDACTVVTDRNKVTFTATRPLPAGEGMTIGVSAPKGTFARPALPTPLQQKGTLYVVLAGLLTAIAYAYTSWNRHGRDPIGPEVTHEFYPPEGVSPASAFHLLNSHQHGSLVTASLTALAIDGYIKIEERKEDGFLGLGKKEYFALLQTDEVPTDKDVPAEQFALYQKLFQKSRIIELDGDYNKDLYKATKAHNDSIREQHKDFIKDGANGWKILPLVGIFVVTIIAAVLFIKTADSIGVVAFGISIPLFFIVLGLYAWLIQQPSYGKVALKNRLKGLRNYLKLSRQDRDALVDAPEMTEEYFQQLLPYAIAFGQDNDWAHNLTTDLANTGERQMNAYPYYMTGFTNRMNTSFADTAHTATSGGGGGGSFSGGGGSVGGGGGGVGGF